MKNEIAVSGQLGMKDESGGDHEKPPTDNNQGLNYIVQEQQDLPTMGESQHVALPIVGLAILILIFVLLVVSKMIFAHTKCNLKAWQIASVNKYKTKVFEIWFISQRFT